MTRKSLFLSIAIVVVTLAGLLWWVAQPEIYLNDQAFSVRSNSLIKIEGEGKLIASSDEWFAFVSFNENTTFESKMQAIRPPEWGSQKYYWSDSLNIPGEWTIKIGSDNSRVNIRPIGEMTVSVHDITQETGISWALIIGAIIIVLLIIVIFA